MSERYVGQPLGERLEELGERVSELEQKYNTIGEKIPETIHKYYTKNKERIEKLEDSLQKCGVKWEFILDEHRGEINELKKSYRNNQTLRDKSFQHIYKIFKKLDKDKDGDAGSARQTDYFCPICGNEITDVEYESFKICQIIVLKADLEFIFSKDPEFMNLEEIKRRRKIKEKYLKEDVK